MKAVSPTRHADRVDAVLDIIRAKSGREALPAGLRRRLAAMSYEELGALAMRIASARTVRAACAALVEEQTARNGKKGCPESQ